MAFQDDLDICAPRLYRFARALVSGHPGPCAIADELVRAALLTALEMPQSRPLAADERRLQLYGLLIERHRAGIPSLSNNKHARPEKENFLPPGKGSAGHTLALASPRESLASRLLALGLEEREALLLVVLEGFTYAEAARILQIPRGAIIARLARARDGLREAPETELAARHEKPRPSYLRLVK